MEHDAEETARFHTFGRPVCGTGTFSGVVEYGRDIRAIEHGDWGQPHNGTVSRAVWVGGAAKGVAIAFKGVQRGAHGDANVKATAVAAHIAMIHPVTIPLHLVGGVKPPALHQTMRQAQRHGGIVRPLPGFQPKRPAAHHIRQWRKRPAWLKLHRRAHRVAAGQPQ